MNRRRGLLFMLAVFSAAMRAQTVTIGSTTQELSPSQRGAVAAYWPDGNMGAFHHKGTNYVFAPTASPGTVEITLPNLNKWTSRLGVVRTTKNVSPGGSGAFDQNYTGGGAVYFDAASGFLIGLYHGEQWWGGSGAQFYSAHGLAYSKDLGVTWRKLGEVVSPQAPRGDGGTHCEVEIGTGTLLVVGRYFYDYYTDMSPGCTSGARLSVAKASISAVIAAAKAGTPLTSGAGTLFMKYTGDGTWNGDGVTDLANPQNGGGAYAVIATAPGGEILEPNVRWNSYLSKYVLAYSNDFTDVELAFSSDGLTWGNPTVVVKGGGDPPNGIYYPTLFNTSGGDPQVLGQNFSVFYVQPFGNWANTSLRRVALSVDGGATHTPSTSAPATKQELER